ncbi:hypothetical protein D3C72_387520 [compost metagenome]
METTQVIWAMQSRSKYVELLIVVNLDTLGGKMIRYDDAYPTCKNTFASLRIFSDTVSPTDITTRLKLDPTDFFNKGDAMDSRGGSRRFNGWFLSSENFINSRDTRRHIDWVLAKIKDKTHEISSLYTDGAEIDISCIWISTGQGGPVISPPQMSLLSTLNIEVWWDVYFDQDSEDDNARKA